MKYRTLFYVSLFVFALLSSLTIGFMVYAQRTRPREDKGEPKCTIQVESSGARTAFLDCINWGTINSSQECTPTHPQLQTKILFERFPQGRQNCRYLERNTCVAKNHAGYIWTCDDEQEPISKDEIQTIICPVSCTRYCPNPDTSQPCDNATWDSTYCEWNISRCRDIGGCRSGFTVKGEKFEEGDSSDLCSPCDPSPWELQDCQNQGLQYDWNSCQCGASPIAIDVLGNGFNLTNAANGVRFDLNRDGNKEQISWTSANSDDAWLTLDRNGNGTIDSGKELFGNFSPQPVPPQGEERNGFLALAVFDKLSNGGNNDGNINHQDAVFASLRLWQDTNHNGLSDAGELKTLNELGLAKVDLDYQESRRTDEHGNRFRFKARVRDTRNAQLGRWAWDVYLVVASGN